jgi:hypothetical protein
MNKSAAEKMLDGSLLSKLGDPRYFIMFSAFGLYWDSYSHFTSGSGLLHMTYKFGDAFPLGKVFFLIASFSLLASFLSPALFWICNRLFWDLWFLIPYKIRPEKSSEGWSRHFSESVSIYKLKFWVIKVNNSLAMSLVKDKEAVEDEMRKNQPQPFLLVLCIIENYFFTSKGILRTTEQMLPLEYQQYFFFGLLAFSALLLYIAFTGISDDAGYIHIPGLKEHIEQKNDEGAVKAPNFKKWKT